RHTRFSRDWSSDVCSSDLASAIKRWKVVKADVERIDKGVIWQGERVRRDNTLTFCPCPCGRCGRAIALRDDLIRLHGMDKHIVKIGRASCREGREIVSASV